MQLKNELYSVSITEDHTFTLHSVDNKPYDAILNPGNQEDYIKAFSISITDSEKCTRIVALVGSTYICAEDCAVLRQSELLVLMNDAVTVINLATLTVQSYTVFSDFGIYFSIYPFADGYVIYGELDIVKLRYDLTVEWSFGGRDIFVSMDGLHTPFQICGDTIKLYDWDNNFYHINANGQLISEIP